DENGCLSLLGRVASQLKVRGYRIEAGEVESALRALPAVREAAVAVRSRGDDSILVGYVVLKQSETGDPPAWRRALAEQLPSHMVPSAFVVLEELPLLPS